MVDHHYGTPEQILQFKAYCLAHQQAWLRWWNNGRRDGPKLNVTFPESCRGMLCGAKTRKGTRCKNDGLSHASGRCKFHGGLSTGPKSIAGKQRSSMNAKRSPCSAK